MLELFEPFAPHLPLVSTAANTPVGDGVGGGGHDLQDILAMSTLRYRPTVFD